MSARRTKPTGPTATPAPVYEANPKHQEPWQRGRKGSLCTSADVAQAQDLLDRCVVDVGKAFSTDGERAFAGAQHSEGRWHGWPVGWKEVPETIRRQFQKIPGVRKSDIHRHWHRHEG